MPWTQVSPPRQNGQTTSLRAMQRGRSAFSVARPAPLGTGICELAGHAAQNVMPTELDPRRPPKDATQQRIRTLSLLIMILGLVLAIGFVAMFQWLARG